ncbi:transcriptional regulator [Porphyrobacter sp. HT-58-2]|uniref:ArsR/SmtB family transcription factor n=1 Tax=Porphyrobacter sp. HT-58-2 TaxID=2023229 RepID=UPI000CDC7DC6|nr:metalloregulator ArsR/SmtB family transcription factor [Porphyrobacter sp. HT-58-2]AUX70276.1 transcriptional regulator [Porphyrobacter sp. HT-58-2]
MPSRLIVSKELAELLKLLAHADRLRLIEELRTGEMDVTGLAETLDLPTTRVSQHLAQLRAQRLVEERRDGRNHFYRLSHPQLAAWIVEALQFVDIRTRLEDADHIDAARALWSTPAPASSESD